MRTRSASRQFVVVPHSRPEARLRLICFPFAGGGASAFYRWAQALPQHIEVCCVQLPGRENRVAETPYTRLADFVPELADALRPYTNLPYALFGHSMGALIAFEAARLLRRKHGTEPVLLIASSHRAPHLPPRESPLHNLPHDQLIDEMRRFDGTPEEVLQNRELMELLLPVVRADFAICETYEYREEDLLGCPVGAVGGVEDNVAEDELASWRSHTRGRFSLKLFPGGHFYFHRDPSRLLAWLAEALATLPDGPRSPRNHTVSNPLTLSHSLQGS